jgi:hypothetical protein
MTTITVTKEHIKHGKRGSCCLCPVALACEAAGFTQVWIEPGHFMLDKQPVAPPLKVDFWINRFDRGEKVRPMKFQVDCQPASVTTSPP